jgi:regulator of protease activity HflC (stomatin/prohibitin superfamily)
MSDALRWEVGLPPDEPWVDRHAIGLVFSGLLAIVVFSVLAPRMFFAIGPGERGVRWSRFNGGSTNEVFHEGVAVIPPWDRLYIYDARVQELSTPITVLTAAQLEIVLQVSIRYHPRIDRLPDLHRRFGPDYARKLVYQEVAAAAQRVLGDQPFEQAIAPPAFARTMQQILESTKAQLAREPVQIDAVRISRITLPPEIAQAINDKLREQQMVELYVYRVAEAKQEAERKSFEAEGIRRFNEIVAAGLSDRYLQWRGIEATVELAKSPNSKIVVIGKSSNGLPVIFDSVPGGKR